MGITPDGRFAFTGDIDKDGRFSTTIWALPSGKVARTIEGAFGRSFSSDSSRIAVHNFRIADSARRKGVRDLEIQSIRDGRVLAGVDFHGTRAYFAEFADDDPGRVTVDGDELLYGRVVKQVSPTILRPGDALVGYGLARKSIRVRNGARLYRVDLNDGQRHLLYDGLGENVPYVAVLTGRYGYFTEKQGTRANGIPAYTTTILDLEAGEVVREMTGFLAPNFSARGDLMLTSAISVPENNYFQGLILRETRSGREIARLASTQKSLWSREYRCRILTG